MFLVINFCENNNISINHSRNTSSSNFSSNQVKQRNNNYSFSMNLKHLNNYSNKNNMNINYGKMGGFEDFDQTRNKFSLRFFISTFSLILNSFSKYGSLIQ